MAVDNVSSVDELTYVPEMPKKPRNIVSIGAGGIVQGSQYPAYKLAGFPVKAVYDVNPEASRKAAEDFGVPHVAETLDELIDYGKQYEAVFDMATPANAICEILEKFLTAVVFLFKSPWVRISSRRERYLNCAVISI
jgi:NADH/NAD ratio-sensing transcriptional regulator Rex